MAQIPTVAAPNLTPPPEINPGIAGAPGRAQAAAADQLGQVADFGAQVTERIQRAQDEGILLNAENQIAADMGKAHAGLANWTDYTHADDLKQQTADALQEKYAAQYADKPRLWRHIEPYLGRQLNEFDNKVDVKSADLTASFNKAALFDSQLNAENEAATEPTLDGKERIWAIQDAKTDLMVKNGTMWPQEAETAKKLLRTRTIQTEVDRAANPMNAPDVMQAEMDRLKEYEGKGYVDPKDLAQMQDHLAISYDRALDRSDRIDVSKQGDAVLTSLKGDPTLKDPETREFDQYAAIKKLDDDPKVPTKVKQYARRELEEEAGATQKLTNDRDQKMLDSLDPHVEAGQLTFAQITQRMNLAPGQKDWIPRRVGDHLLTKAAQIQRENRVENMQERGLMRQEAADKSREIMFELLGSDGYIAERSELAQYTLKGLSKADEAQVWAMKNVKNSSEYGEAYKFMRASGIYPQTDQGNEQFATDLTNLRKQVEDQKLVGQQITDAAKKIIEPKVEAQKSWAVGQWLNNIFSRGVVTSEGQTALPSNTAKPAAKDAPPPPTENFSAYSSDGKWAWNGSKWVSREKK